LTLWMMNNYKPKSVVGNVYYKLGNMDRPANDFGAWDRDEFKVEDSAFGFITMENGATISLESSWALNIREAGEAQVTLCGTKAGADMKDGLQINGHAHGRKYVNKIDLNAGGVAFFEGASDRPDVLEAQQWINCIINDTEPLVKPEEALVVTQILEAIYESAKTGKAVIFE
ncbi:MAG: Gfo/Idh/MocA family oxidoreductase, partial [Turicibacter sp.]